jgi:hypothetical protein
MGRRTGSLCGKERNPSIPPGSCLRQKPELHRTHVRLATHETRSRSFQNVNAGGPSLEHCEQPTMDHASIRINERFNPRDCFEALPVELHPTAFQGNLGDDTFWTQTHRRISSRCVPGGSWSRLSQLFETRGSSDSDPLRGPPEILWQKCPITHYYD